MGLSYQIAQALSTLGDVMNPIVIKNCAYCGKDVEIYHKKRLELKNVFCSRECLAKYRKSLNLNMVCPVCGTRFHLKGSRISKIHDNCCSYKCMGEYRKTKYFGEGNPNYGNTGTNNPLFSGDRILHCGYYWVYAPDHPFCVDGGRIGEHRLIAEKYLMKDEQSIEIDGVKYLNPIYDVHHIDGNKLNNNIDNLMIVTRSEHAKIHAQEKLRNK